MIISGSPKQAMLLRSNRARQSLDTKVVSVHMGTECKNDGNLEKCKAESMRNRSEMICNIKCEFIMCGIIN